MKKKSKRYLGIFLLILLSCMAAACKGKAENETTTAEGVIAQTKVMENETVKAPASYTAYEPFGLHYDEEKKELLFENERVRYFYDGVALTDETASVYCDYLNEEGTVDVHTRRETIVNSDGSINPFGKLTGIERYSQEEFDQRDLSDFYGSVDAVTEVSGSCDPNAKTFTQIFEAYRAFGIEYVEAENASGAGNIYCNKQLVRSFTDITPDGGTFSFHSADGGKIKVQTIYDQKGNLVGVEEY